MNHAVCRSCLLGCLILLSSPAISSNLDSSTVAVFFKTYPVSDSVRSQVYLFYTGRKYQYAWFGPDGMTEAASNFYNQLQNYRNASQDNSFSSLKFNLLFVASLADQKKFLQKQTDMQQLELMLTSTFFMYSRKVYGGLTKGPLSLNWFIPREKRDYQALLDSLVVSGKDDREFLPLNEYYTRLQSKLEMYRRIEKQGGFPVVMMQKKQLAAGETDPSLIAVKRHLFLSGDLATDDHTDIYSDSCKLAVIKFQHRLGLPENGMLDSKTVAELNKPVSFRIRQMLINLERLRWVPVAMENDYLLVNIPEFRLHIFENHQQVWQTNVVVGKAATRTSIFKGAVSQVVFNPYWNVPSSIMRKEIRPHINRDGAYLSRHNMEYVPGDHSAVRQKPGVNNALGRMKFLFPNSYNIYLHDTPQKSLLEENTRAFSHGCIRVKEPKRLAVYLLRKTSGWNDERIEKVLTTTRETAITLRPTIPVYIAYFTAWVDNTGQLNFRNDIYGMDSKLFAEIFGK